MSTARHARSACSSHASQTNRPTNEFDQIPKMSDEGPRPKKGETLLKDTFLKWPFAKDFVYDVTTDGKVDNVKCIGLPCSER